MGIQYNQISMEERCHISLLRKEGKKIREIAAIVDRTPSSISRELKRNTTSSNNYNPQYADLITKSRRWTGSKLDRNQELRETVLSLLKQGLSPEEVSGRLALIHNKNIISYETIYRFVYSQIKRLKDYSWRHYLPQAKHKRSRRKPHSTSPANTIANRVSIHQRPPIPRDQLGHWEADLMLFAKYSQALLVVQDRASRLLFVTHQPNKAAQPVANSILSIFKHLPPVIRQSITFDNGTEFAYHHQLHPLDVKTYFCDPHAPWQKGGVENAIGRLRRRLPRKTDISTLSHSNLQYLVAAYNHTPRKCLGYHTPAEVFARQLLHFECESTSLLSQG